jgi:hypothetical protein
LEGDEFKMKDSWEENLSCATRCAKCGKDLGSADERVLSVYDHEPICLSCKKEEEKRADYPEVSKKVIGQCMADQELTMVDPEGYCFHHFYPYKC